MQTNTHIHTHTHTRTYTHKHACTYINKYMADNAIHTMNCILHYRRKIVIVMLRDGKLQMDSQLYNI